MQTTQTTGFSFHLNGELVRVDDVSPNLTLLEFLRRSGRTGTKEGCAEGDCGACSVAVSVPGSDGKPCWRSINSCLVPLPALAGRQVLTVEGLVGQASSLPCGASSPRSQVSKEIIEGKMPPKAGLKPAPLLNPPPFVPFDKQRPAAIHSRRLPHWQQEGATYFVTFRLGDALPHSAQEQLQRERDAWFLAHPDPRSTALLTEFADTFLEQLDAHLDLGHGACWLGESAVAEVVQNALHHFDGERYWLGSYVIMPNHVHALVRPIAGHALSDILHSWKSFTANQANKALGRQGQFWQDESFDHIVRDEHHLEKFGRYIAENPAKARLSSGSFRVGHGSAALGPDDNVVGQASSLSGGASSPRSQVSKEIIEGKMPSMTGWKPAPLLATSEFG